MNHELVGCHTVPVDPTASTCPPETVLDEAARIIYGPRQADYGTPSENIGNTAKMWSIILGTKVSARDVLKCMIAVKLSRDRTHEKRDNMVDICGWAALSELIGDKHE